MVGIFFCFLMMCAIEFSPPTRAKSLSRMESFIVAVIVVRSYCIECCPSFGRVSDLKKKGSSESESGGSNASGSSSGTARSVGVKAHGSNFIIGGTGVAFGPGATCRFVADGSCIGEGRFEHA